MRTTLLSSQIQDLKDRLKALEQHIATFAADKPTVQSPSQYPLHVSAIDWATSVSNQEISVNHQPPGGFAPSMIAESSSMLSPSDPVDGMGAVILQNEELLTFFGPSSNISFTRHITQMVARLGHIANPRMISVDDFSSSLLNSSSPSSNQFAPGVSHDPGARDPFGMPGDDQIDVLVEQYFSDVGLLFPNLHKPTFLESVAEMKRKRPRSMRRTWLGLLNMVLAFGTLTIVRDDWGAELRAAEARTFYERAVCLCDPMALAGTSLEVVQYLLLLAQYLQATHNSVQTTNALGLAVNTAIRIGLHSRQASESLAPLERELRNRTWYLCVVLDRVLGMTLGRPAAIPYSYVKIDLPRQFEISASPVTLYDPDEKYSLGVFNATIKLYQIMWKVIDQQYGQNLGFDTPPAVVDVIAPLGTIDHDLRIWERDLPQELQTITSSNLLDLVACYNPAGPLAKAQRFRIVLTLRYLNVTVLLHRPVLVKYFELASLSGASVEMALLSRLGRNSIDVCFRSSMEIISIVNTLAKNTGPAKYLLNVWWFTLYYTFNAGLVIAGIMLACQDSTLSIPDPPTRRDCKEGLQKAVDALAHLDRGNKIVGRCHDYLHRLLGAIETLTFKPSDFVTPDLRSVLNSDVSSARFLSTPNLTSTSMNMAYNGVSRRNVGDLMSGDDMGFLNFYFASAPDVNSENAAAAAAFADVV
ncbi:hypothetical protein LTR41_003401 [Exophiala xenobiotica]|nr:hypothetical protein LTR41_003401 [Exophiala xenobiotica]